MVLADDKKCPTSECGFVTDTFTIQCCMTGKGTTLDDAVVQKNTAGFCAPKTATNYVEALPDSIGVVGDLTYKKTTCTTPNATKT